MGQNFDFYYAAVDLWAEMLDLCMEAIDLWAAVVDLSDGGAGAAGGGRWWSSGGGGGWWCWRSGGWRPGILAGVERVPAWMPLLVYSVTSFLPGSLLVADVEWEELGDRGP